MCMVKARSALLLGASTPAGAKGGALMSKGFAAPSHLIEYGGLETMASKGSSSQWAGSVRVSPWATLNFSYFTSCGNMVIRHRLKVVRLLCGAKKPGRTASCPSTLANLSNSEPEPQAGSYTLLISVLLTTVMRASSSETSCGV